MDVSTIGERVRSWRKRQKLTQPALSEKAKLNVGTIKDIEKGYPDPAYSTLHKIAVALGIQIAQLVSDITESDIDTAATADQTDPARVTSVVTTQGQTHDEPKPRSAATEGAADAVTPSSSRVQQSVEQFALAALENLCEDLLVWIANRQSAIRENIETGERQADAVRNSRSARR